MPPQWIGGVVPPGARTMHLLVCGTRTFTDYRLLARKLDRFTFWFEHVEVYVGGRGTRKERNGRWVREGADWFANQWAEANWWPRHLYHADWDTHGKAAGPRRNAEMVEAVADRNGHCVAFWDGKSPGTAHAIELARTHLPRGHLKIVRYDK